MKRLKATVYGRVQGVGFRYFTQTLAMDLHLTGWVRNEMDGSVCLEAYGEEPALHKFLTKIEEGPRFGKVHHVDVTWDEVDASPENQFNIR
jgi:acylphosphatase